MIELLRRWVTTLLDLVLPRGCAGCGVAGDDLCGTCSAALLDPPARLHDPSPRPAGLPRLAVAADYDGPVRAVLLAHKERGRLALAGPLGAALSGAVQLVLAPAAGPAGVHVTGLLAPRRGTLLLVPVPSSAATVRARGQDHALRLARAAARQLRRRGVPARAAPLLRPARAVADQSGLSAAARSANLRGALVARRGHDGLVVVVDDVVTTGATLVEAARALRAAGADVRGAAVVGATQRRPAAGVRAGDAGAGHPP